MAALPINVDIDTIKTACKNRQKKQKETKQLYFTAMRSNVLLRKRNYDNTNEYYKRK